MGALLLVVACSAPAQRKAPFSSVEHPQLITTARDYLLRGRRTMRVTERAPKVSYHATSVEGPPFWRVDFETVAPAPRGYRIPPGTPMTRVDSVYLDTNGRPFKRS